ncbi:DUF488 domain-containing protein [Yoonia sediminilitoris]|uniref:Uncharacterized protein DUF488 n=1 Tax=Yoonia sediminilitoris TaxID=1286148 RepID=A0A2T6KF45_9RHOB|nr:uncharacterized protein DUF488 [Yoonia sediminilitoris]RCW94887.1 uncharacterized protein DUF488 [Yoonia sediminilitoris]
MGQIFTIGYSGQEVEGFVKLLSENGVDVVCDVRSTPFSHYKPDFSRGPFRQHLNAANIKYAFFGDQLGARPKDRSCYVSGQATYDRIARTDFFNEGLNRLRLGARKLNLALVCSEKDPIECHRAVLVCYNLPDLRNSISHIHTDGAVEDQAQFEQRLVKFHGLTPPPLLQRPGDWDAAVVEAYKKQAAGIAYRER